ncbi:MAG: hypothetical protein EBS05_05840 [Proteobacteria bacterium]|nr:hypothetical protein [Pseudomonadota bacterium]
MRQLGLPPDFFGLNMIGTIRKHSQWLWAIIITVVIISFVIFFTPDANKLGGSRGEASYGTIYGEPIKRDDLVQAYSDARLGYFLSTGQWPDRDERARMFGFNLDAEARQRLLLNYQLKQHGIDAGDAAVAQEIKNIFTEPQTGAFSLQRYDSMLKQHFASAGISEAGFERFLKNELGRQQLARMFGLSGKLISDKAADGFYRRENEQALTEFVFLSSSNYLAKVKVDDAALRAYHTNNLTAYRIPERVTVHYVYFPYTNYNAEADKLLAANTNLMGLMEAYYKTNTFRFRETNGTAKTFEQAKEQIRTEFRDEAAARLGQQKAGEFANEVFKLPNKAESLLRVAVQKGLTVKATEPFTQFEGPKSINAPANFGRTAFELSAEEALGQMLPGSDGVFLIAFKDRLKPVDPPFEQVKAKVAEDYRKSQSSELTLQEGTKLVQAANDALAKGKSFKDAAKELGHVAFEVPAFNRAARKIEIVEDKGLGADEYRDQAFALAAGKVGKFQQTSTGGYVIFVKAFQPVADQQVKTELAEYTKSLRENRANYAFREWLGREVERSGVMGSPKTGKAQKGKQNEVGE